MTMNDTRVRVSIVIPAHNEERHLKACLDAIVNQTSAPFEVIVVDNNCTDKTAAIASRYPFVVVVDESQQGIVHARNAGFDVARGDVIGRIDADIQIPPNWVGHIQKFYAKERNANRAWSGSGYFYNVKFPQVVSWAYSVFAFGLNRLLLGHYTLWGSNMAITAKQWQVVRSTTCSRTDIHEDLDLAIHLHEQKYKIVYDRTIKTSAELRRVQTDRHKLWSYLQLWPRTLKLHNKKIWPVCWFLGAFVLYWATFILVFADGMSSALTRFMTSPRTATQRR